MKKKGAVIYLSFLLLVSLLLPAFVIKKSIDMKSGWKGLVWGKTEGQVKEWIKRNNSNYNLVRCTQSHYGVVCWKLSWKNEGDTNLEYIEFQFQDGKLCAVIETEKVSQVDPLFDEDLGSPLWGNDVKSVSIKEKGVKYTLTERVFYYLPEEKFKATKQKIAVSRLVKNALAREDIPEEVVSWRLTRGFYSRERFEEIKNQTEDFPSAHF